MRTRTLLLLVSVLSLSACGIFQGDAKSPQAQLFDCRVKALEPAVAGVYDAADLARRIYEGDVSLAMVINALQLKGDQVKTLVNAFRACEGMSPEPVPPTPEPS